MKKCIELAQKAIGSASPNPLVGCVVLDKFGNEISTGYHHKYGDNHAERDALLKVDVDKTEGGTLIVNLEPCSHYGKTPPCVDLIIERKISKVVVGIRDVNPVVSGNGIAKLKNAGIEVVEDVLKDECEKLNEVFITNHTEKRCFVATKVASTLDGKIATSSGSSKWITSEIARDEVKVIRNMYDAILTSSSTVIADNPTMAHKNKIVLDRELKTDFHSSNIYKNGNIYVFHSEKLNSPDIDGINFIKTPEIDNKLDLQFVLTKVFELGIMSVLVEAGGKLNGNILPYVDKIYHFIAPKITSDNDCKSCFDSRKIFEISECYEFKFDELKKVGSDILLTYYRY